MKKTINTCLWFNGQAKEAASFYCSIFENSKITDENPMVVAFELNGRKFMGLNGGPEFSFNEAISFVVDCDTQDEIDFFWEKLSAVPEAEQCGWCKDKYGLSWQIVPESMEEMMKKPGAFEIMMEQKKIIIAEY